MTHDEFLQAMALGPYSPGIIRSGQEKRYNVEKAGEMSMVRRAAAVEDKHPLPKSVNWIAKGAVAPVKNQGMCGTYCLCIFDVFDC